MKVVLQRSKNSSVSINNKVVGSINMGLVVLLGVGKNDTIEDIDYLVNKIINLRIFEDDEGKMNKSLIDVDGEILLVSQFTLYAETRKGRRPSFISAGSPEKAIEYYEIFKDKLIQNGIITQSGIFQAEMEVNIVNDGPVTIIIDTEDNK
ncbi:MAG: dtd [Fusobacteria bacterium]|nr:MAG: dtd [Fusobacteriota bacterium]KAF0229826.1 MAG: hypothetical protein FD182_216 [Fusobacteriota bacterium]